MGRLSLLGSSPKAFAVVASLVVGLGISPAYGNDTVEPEIRYEDGLLVIEAVVGRPVSEIRPLLGDIQMMSDISPDILETTSQAIGACHQVTRKTRGLWRSLELRLLRCPTADGWKETLLQPGDYTAYESLWEVREAPGGSHLSFKLRTEVNLPVPDALVKRQVQSASKQSFLTLVGRILTGRLKR